MLRHPLQPIVIVTRLVRPAEYPVVKAKEGQAVEVEVDEAGGGTERLPIFLGTTEGRREVGVDLDQTVVLEHVDVLVGAGFVKLRPRQARLIGGDRGGVGAAEEGEIADGTSIL